MMRNLILTVFLTNVFSRPFDIEWRLAKLREEHFRDIMDIRADFNLLIKTVNNRTSFCENENEAESLENGAGDDTVDNADDAITGKGEEHLGGLKKAFSEEKQFLRHYLKDKEIQQDSKIVEMEGSISIFRAELLTVQHQVDQLKKTDNELESYIESLISSLTVSKEMLVLYQHNMDVLQEKVTELESHLAKLEASSSSTNETLILYIHENKILKEKVSIIDTKQSLLHSFELKNLIKICAPNSCYFIGDSATWHEAEESCLLYGAKLAEIENEEENDFLVSVIPELTKGKKDVGVYIGGNDIDLEGTWVWSASNRTIEELYMNFKNDEPNGGTRENCLHLYRHANWKWNDIRCDRVMGFLCEF